MVGLLMWHLFPDWDYMSRSVDRPRFSWGPGKTHTRHLIKANARVADETDYVRYAVGDRPSAVDATLYIGEKDGPLLWRVQNKVTDQRNLAGGTILQLADKDRRARVEVTMGTAEIAELGILTFADLRRFSFGKLQGRYFRVMLPTIKTNDAARTAVDTEFEKFRLTKFKNTGVIGLTAMDAARESDKAAGRAEVVRNIRKAGMKIRPRVRVGIGSSGTLVSYVALGRLFEGALRGLTKRECIQTV